MIKKGRKITRSFKLMYKVFGMNINDTRDINDDEMIDISFLSHTSITLIPTFTTIVCSKYTMVEYIKDMVMNYTKHYHVYMYILMSGISKDLVGVIFNIYEHYCLVLFSIIVTVQKRSLDLNISLQD